MDHPNLTVKQSCYSHNSTSNQFGYFHIVLVHDNNLVKDLELLMKQRGMVGIVTKSISGLSEDDSAAWRRIGAIYSAKDGLDEYIESFDRQKTPHYDYIDRLSCNQIKCQLLLQFVFDINSQMTFNEIQNHFLDQPSICPTYQLKQQLKRQLTRLYGKFQDDHICLKIRDVVPPLTNGNHESYESWIATFMDPFIKRFNVPITIDPRYL